MKNYITELGNNFVRRSFELPDDSENGLITISADFHRYLREFCQPLRGDGNDGNWLVGGSFIKFRLYFDGKLIGIGPFRPIKDGTRVEHAFKLRNLKKGKHVIAVAYRGENHGINVEFSSDMLELSTDKSWKIFNANMVYAPICFRHPNINGYFKGDIGPGEYFEHLNGPAYPDNWETPDFDDSKWANAPVGKLELGTEKAAWNYCLSEFAPVKITKTADNRHIIDFGTERIGSLSLVGSKMRGEVEVRLGEELLTPDRVRYQLRASTCYQEMWEFTPGHQQLSHFGLRIFRYAELVNYLDELTPDKIKIISVNAPFNDDSSTLASTDDNLNQVWQLCKNSVKATSMDTYTDCFSRERIAYEADGYINMLANFAVTDSRETCIRFLDYVIDHPTWPCEWMQMLIPIFYEYYWESGDKEMIEKHFDKLLEKALFRHLIVDGLVKKFPLEAIIEHPFSDSDNYDKGNQEFLMIPNALVYKNLKSMAFLAKEIGKNSLSEELFAEAKSVKTAINAKFFNPETKLYFDRIGSSHSSLHANLWALWCGLVEDENVGGIINFIEHKGMICSLYTSFFYLDTLFKYGRSEKAYSYLVGERPYSWMNMIRQGATITTEIWPTQPDYHMSFAHPWGTTPAVMIVRHVFGLTPTRPGYAAYEIKPKPTALKSAELQIFKKSVGLISRKI